ncbi:MAG: rRNA pseudouridine synthase [Bacilli bacterium]|nr:rRNA pseudouridine synthase [Bacilli bacterium]
MERLQKVIAASGITSRRKAEELISSGKVMVEGKIITELGYKVEDGASIVVDGVKINREDKVYYLLNKPRGVVTTTSDDKGRKTVIDLIEDDRRIYPVGRLDYDTTGALILTNDGEFANNLMHPKNEIDKVYIAKIKGFLTPSDMMSLKNGVVIDGKKTSKAKVKVRKTDRETRTSTVEIIIHEGRNHQVKNMFGTLGYEVLKLKRERIAFLDIKNLNSGEYRVLNPKEVKQLYVLTQQKKSTR